MSNLLSTMRTTAVRATSFMPIFLLLLQAQTIAQPTVGGFSTPLGYIERSAPLAVAGGITLASGNDYSDGYIEFVVTSGTSADVLGYITASTPSTSLNVVTIVGTSVYRGNGSIAKIIGAVDQTFNGLNGQKLRINFSAALENAQFNERVNNGLLPGWTITNAVITDQSFFPRTQARALTISGANPYTVTRRIGQTTPGSTSGTIEYQFQTDFNYNPNSRSWWGYEGQYRGGNVSLTTNVVNDPLRSNNQALMLKSSGGVPSPNTNAYGSIFGPMVVSSNFQAFQGDQLTLEWYARRISDDYEVYGYIEEVNTNVRTLLFYGRGANQPWTTVSGTIPATGTYRFRFINGTYDQTGGFAVGSELYIDNIRIISSETTDDAIAQAVARLVTYEHTSCTPPASRTLTVNARTAAGQIGTASNTINITEINCAPTYSATVLANRTHTSGGSATSLFSASNASTQEANQTFVEWRLTYSGFVDGANEVLQFDGTNIPLVNGSGTTATNAIAYTVLNGVITFTKAGGVTPAVLNTALDAMTYNSLGVLTPGARTVSLSYLKDDGGTVNSGVDEATFAANVATSTINVLELTASVTTLPLITRCTPSASTEESFTVSGANLQGNVSVTAPASFEVSLSSGTGFASSVAITASGTLSPRTVYVRLTSAATGTPAGNVTVASSGATSQLVAVSGSVSANSSNLSITNSLCGNQSLLWATWNSVNATGGTGTFGNLGVTVSVSHSRGGLSTTPSMYSHNAFPSQYTVPNTVSLRNDLSGVFTFTFSQPITNPQVAFSSIGNPGTSVGINTSVPYAVVWNGQNVVYNTSTRFTGNEGNTIVSFPGTHQTITLEYLADETYANLAFGFENFNCTAPQICPGDAVTLTASGGAAYAWSPATGLNITNAAQVIASPTVTTTYTVTDPNNPCATPRNITINVSQIPTAPTATATQLVCPGATVATLAATVGTGQSLRWYSASTGGTALSASTALVLGSTYYAEAVDLTCGPSPTRTAVTVQRFPDLVAASADTAMLIRGTPIVIDSMLVINETNTINGALVFISSGFVSGDVLAYNGTLPAGVSRSYNPSTGVLTFTGNIAPADLQAALRQVTINTSSTVAGLRRVTFNIGSALPFSTNGHFYEFVTSAGISWTAAKTAAQARTLYGRQGYLVTVTSAAENQFVASKLAGQGWLGATDAAVENVWRWDTGPEEGQQFWQGLGSNLGGSSVNGLYNNWASGEPNNAGNEDYAHFLSNGTWNDYPLQLSNISGYVVEYGGMPNDACAALSSSKSVSVTTSFPPSVTTSSPIGVFTDVTASISGQVTSDGDAALTERGFVIGLATSPTTTPATGGFKLVNPTSTVGSYSGTFTGLAPNTLYFARAYAINARGTSYGNEISFTTAPVQPAAITTDRNDATFGGAIICAGTSITLTSSVTTGTIEWLADNCTGTVLGTGNSITVSPTTTTTYFARTFNSATGLRSSCAQVPVTVQAAAPNITYAAPYYLYYSGEAIATNTISVSGSGAQAYVASYSISPALPAGLNFNTATAAITGTAVNGNTRTTYTVTGITPCGNVTTTVAIEVLQCAGFVAADFALRGNATFNAGASEFVLTTATGNQFGATWNQTRLDLTQDFDINSQIFLGTSDAGADGIAFVLQPLSLNQGSSGGGLGYAGINPSVAVEFDTWDNGGEPAGDHAAFMINGNTSNHTTGSYSFPGNIEDGQYRAARFKWEAATKTFRVFVSGTQILTKTNWDIVATVFNNNPYVYWGFTGATGGAVNLQKVKFDRYCLTVANNTVADLTTVSPIGTLTNSTAAISGEVVSDGGTEVTERGFVLSTATAPTTANTRIVSAGTGVGLINGTFTGLQPATLYYARSYAVNSTGTGYGNEISFYTRPADVTGVTSSDFNTTHQANVICFGAATTLTAAGVSGAVHWYTASCGGTQVGVGATLVVSPTVTTTYFARNFNNNLFSDGCAQITVVVRPQIVPQTISGAETICWNSRPVGFTGTAVTGGTGPWTYQWQQREFLNGVWGAWTNIAQATNFAAYRPDFMFTTTEFRLLATDTGSPACTTDAASNVITVTVRDPFTPSIISVNNGAYAFCENDQLTLTATPTLGGSGPPYQYQWQQSSDSINWVNVGPAQNNQINLVVSNLSADTYYRLIAFDLGTPGCGSVFSINGFKVFVQPTVLAGGISGSQHICAQTAPAAIASTNPGAGRGTLSYRWESSQNGGTSWNTIAGANAASYQPGVLTTTTDFRRYTISTFQGAACESPLAADSTIRILVDSLPIAQVFGQLRDTACVNAPYQLMGGYSSNGTRAWTHNGVGSLLSTTALQPIYTPVAADAGNVVQFTMVVTGSQICGLTTDTARFDLLIDSLPYAIAGVADTICSNRTYQVVGASAAYGTVQWSHNGAGTLQQANTLTPTYVAAAGDEGNRVRLILSVTSNNTCVGLVDRDTVFVSVDPLPVAVAGGTDIICAGTSSQISGASAQHGTILWTIDAASGSGTILNGTTLTPTYVADTLDAGSTVRLKMTVTSTNTCNPQTAVAYFDVVVRPYFVSARLVNQNQELCYNTSARVITAQPAVGGTGPYGYQWQISADSTTWTNIAGAVNLTYTQPGIMSATRYYRILSTDLGNPVCGTIVSSTTVAKITVFEPLTPPLFASNQITVCNGTSAVILPQPARGGRNDFRYQWQQSANGTTGWVNVGPPSQSLQFSSPALTSGTYYRVIGRDQDFPNGDPSCGSVFSNAVRIIVADPVVEGAITGTQTICLGSTAAVIQSQTPGTGSGTVSYAWEENTGQGWSRIAGATSATYNAGALTTTTQFRRITVATLNGVACESVASNAVTITVDNPAQFTAASQGDTTLMALASVCSASAFNYQVAATAPSAITYTYSMSGATVDTGAGTGSGRVFNVGVTAVRVYGATNCAVSVHAFNVTVNDTVRPTIVAQNLTVNLDANGQAVITPAMVDNGSSDNCGIASTTLSATSFTCANVGANQVTFTVTDVNGNVRQANVVVTVVDAILPTVVAQPLTVFLNAAGQASITAAMVDNGSSDNCGLATLSLSQTNFSCSNVGANNITFTVTDVNGNTNQAVAVITVRDTLKPIVLARNLTVALNASGQASITAAMVDSGSTDNCAIATSILDLSSFSCANVGANNVTLTVTDVNGNAQTATVVVTVIDTLKPIVVAQNITVNLDANGQAVITPAMVDNGSTDNCSIASRTLNVSSFSCANVGANPVTLTVTDVNGNVSQANVVVTVVDADTPIVRVQSRTVFLDANGAGQLTAAQVDSGSSDNCAIAQLQLSQTQFGCADIGTNVLTLTVTDVHGNVGVNRVNVVVADTIAPVVTRFASDTLYVTRDACAALYYWRDSISVFDACGSFTVQSAWPNVILLNKGQHQLNFTVTDLFGNARAYSRPVVVIDTIRPTILNVPANVTIYAGANCGRTYTWVQPTPSDNCTGITMTSNFNSGDFFPLGTTQVQYFVTDAVGLTNQASFTITVVDTTPPMIVSRNASLMLNASGQAVLSLNDVLVSPVNDPCGVQSVQLSQINFNCTQVGSNQVLITAIDVNGNTSQATVVVTVIDTVRPTIVAQNITVNLDANGQAVITPAMVNNGSSDNCGIASSTLSATTFTCANVGANQVTFTVTDVNGNTSQATVVVTVLDTLKPVIIAQNVSVALNAAGQASITAAMVDNGSTDNCSIASRTLSQTNFSCSNVGANNVTLTVTDVNGNVSQATVVVTVLDTLKPIVLAQNLTVALDANGQSNITVGMVNIGTSDNCGIDTLALSRTNFNCTHVGANNVILTATDVHGNISQVTVVVTVVDNFPPVARTRNLTAYLGINGLVNITAAMVDSGSSDNCGIASMTISKTSFNCSNTGLNNVTFSVIDLYGNTALRTVTVNVLDTIKPVIQLAADTITAYLGSNQCLASVSLTGIQITDNCGAPTVVTSPASGAAFSVGITPVSITATDASGNQRQRMLYVRVLDTIAPMIVGMPTTVTMAYDSLQCGAVVSWAQPVAIDNCATGLSSNLASGTFFGVGSHTVIYTATDPSGNSTQRTIQFTVNDVFAPRWTSVPASITLIAASNSCSAVASWTTPTATDNCSSVTLGGSHTSGSTFPVGITTVVLTATDAAGNVANHSFTVTVRDTIAPTVASMPGNAVLGICQATFSYPAPTATDACGTVTISQISGLASGSVFPLGTTTNVFRFTDASGNTATASFTVTVQSTSLPFVPVNLSFCSNDTVQDLSRGYTGYVFFGNGISNGIFFNPAQAVVGNQAIDFTFTDSIGCSTSGRIIISVSPSPMKPVIERVNATTLRARDVYDAYQWYRYDQPIFGATQQSYVVSVSGVYTLKVSNNFGCEVFSDPFGFGVGINVEELGKDGFNIYPNPNKGRFFVHHAFDDLQTRTILVLDMLGKVVYQQESNTAVTELDLAHLAQGRYFVRIESEKELGIKSVIIRY